MPKMRRPCIVWLLVVMASIGLTTLVERASSSPDKYRETSHAAVVSDDKPSAESRLSRPDKYRDTYRSGLSETDDEVSTESRLSRPDKYRDTYRSGLGETDDEASTESRRSRPSKHRETSRAAVSSDDEPIASEHPSTSKGSKKKPKELSSKGPVDKVQVGKASKGDKMTMCDHELKFDLENMSEDQLIAARVLVEQGHLIGVVLKILFGKEIAGCFYDLVGIATKAIDGDEDTPEGEGRSVFGGLVGKYLGSGVGNIVDGITGTIHKVSGAFGMGDAAQAIASVGNDIVGALAPETAAKEKKRADEQALNQTVDELATKMVAEKMATKVAAKRMAELDAKEEAAELAARKEALEQAAKKMAEELVSKKKTEEEEAKKKKEEEAAKKKTEEHSAKRKKEKQEAKKKKEEQEEKKKKEEQEAKKKKKEEREAKKKKEEQEEKKKKEEQAAKKKKEEQGKAGSKGRKSK